MPAKRTPKPQSGVTDALGFAFTTDDADAPVTAPTRRARPVKSATEAPHFHDHRKRLRARFADAGAAALADYELLELFLFRTIPRIDTKPLAKALITRFGSLAGVLAAEPARIAEVPGAGEAVALDLKAAQALFERAMKAELQQRPVIGSWSRLVEYCKLAMAHEPREQFRVLFLDRKNQLIADEVLWTGTVDQAAVYPRELVRRALELSAASIILTHNHPSGDPTPSAADLSITREIIAAAKTVGVSVHDHLVVGRSGVRSFKSDGLI